MARIYVYIMQSNFQTSGFYQDTKKYPQHIVKSAQLWG